MSVNPANRSNPFPGLRPFRSDEHHLFFGREEQTSALLQLLRQNRFLAVVGTSGSGKSSLVRSGMIAELHGGTMTQAGSTWEVMLLRPGGSPIENLARAMVDADLYDVDDPSTLPRLKATLSRSRFGLVEAMKQSDMFEPGTNMLVVVDQFEELFRFRQQGVESEEAATAFVNLLLTASEQAECPIYVTITMRSDYLGDCSEIPGLAEAVNEGEYLIPRLQRDQKRDAIEKPIGVGGAKIAPLLVQRLLNEVGDDPDQLPVLQHALMRMWEVWSAGSDHDRPIDLSDFETTGGLASALSNHADEIYDSLPSDHHRFVCGKVFETLTEKGDDNRGIRRPTRLTVLESIAGADRETVTVVLDAFRNSGVTFLMPGMEVELDDRAVLDLSHESLMRGWQRLRGWVEDEAQSARIFRRLVDTARLWSDGKAGLFRDPDLQITSSWREQKKPNAEWAQQYSGDFETAIEFLETSYADAEAEQLAQEAARQRELEQAQQLAEVERQRATDQAQAAGRLRWMVRGVGLVAMIAVTTSIFAWYAWQESLEKAVEADGQRNVAQTAQKRTQQALEKAEVAEGEALQAEQRSREFRYATDIQLATTLIADETANVGQVMARLADHDPEINQELADKDDLRSFEWHYLKRQVGGRGVIFSDFENEIVKFALTPDGELVTLDSDLLLQRWDPKTRQETAPALDLKQGRTVTAHALSPDGSRVALGVGNKVLLLDASTGEEITHSFPASTWGGLMFSPDGKMVITIASSIGWWDAATGKPIALQDFKLTRFSYSGLQPVAVSEDGLTVAVGWQSAYRSNFSVFKMDPASRDVTQLLKNAGVGGTKRTLAISADGKTVATNPFFEGGIYLYDTSTGKLLVNHASAHSSSISAMAFSPHGTQLVTAAMDGSVKIWEDYRKFETTDNTALVGHSEQVDTVAFSADGKQVISTGKDKTLRLWDLEQNTSSMHQVVAGANGFRARYSPDGTLMAVSRENRLQLRDGATGQVVAQLPKRTDELGSDSVAFSPDNRLLAAGFGGGANVSYVELWDIDRRELLSVLPGSTDIPGFTTDAQSGMVSSLAFSPDGQYLVAGFGSTNLLTSGNLRSFPLLVYDVAARRVIRRLEGPRNYCISVSFSRDGSRLANACYDGSARIWDTATWQELHVLNNPDPASDSGGRRVYDVAFSPDGSRLAMASAENNVIIWNAETGEHLETLNGHSNEVWSVAFSPNGRTLASGSIDGTVRLWNTATWRELVQLAPEDGFAAKSLNFSRDGNHLLAASGSKTLIWSVHTSDNVAQATLEHVAQWLEPELDFQNRIRLQSENLQLHESLELLSKEEPDNHSVQAALAATRVNWHASRAEWKQATEQFNQLKQLSPENSADWWRTPGLLRLANALLHQDRFAEAAMLLTGGETRRAEDGNGTRAVGFGFNNKLGKYPVTLTHVYRGSPAWQAGLREGDRILKFNDAELTAKTYSDLSAQSKSGTPITLTIQRPNQELPKTVEVTGASYIRDDVTVELIEKLLAAIDQKLAESPNHAGLLELRAEIATLSSDYERQVADYSAAIEALSQQPADEVAADLTRLYRRRGNAYVGLKQWQAALDDFARGNLDETAEEKLLDSQALARRRAMQSSQWTVLKPLKAKSKLGATLEILPDDSILASRENPLQESYNVTLAVPVDIDMSAVRLEALTHESLPNQGPGRNPIGTFAQASWKVTATLPDGETKSLEFDDAWADYQLARYPIEPNGHWNIYTGHGKNCTAIWSVANPVPLPAGTKLKFEMRGHANSTSGENIGRFRLSLSDDTEAIKNQKRYLSISQIPNPWARLAATYLLNNDQQSVDRLVHTHPSVAAQIGDLFIQDKKNRQWTVEDLSTGPVLPTGVPRQSVSSKVRTTLTVLNRTDEPVELFWIDFSGERKSYGMLAAGARSTLNTFASHVWEVVTSDGQALTWFQAQETAATAEIRSGSSYWANLDTDSRSQDKVWLRAVGIYSVGIKSDKTDEELLAKRAQAYEQLRDWNAAAADWTRAAGDTTKGATLLADFANRLVGVEQYELAATQRKHARQLLEAILQADPGDDPAVDALAKFLVDMSKPIIEWTVLKPIELKTAGGSSVALRDDGSFVIDTDREDTLALPELLSAVKAIRIETASVVNSGESPTFSEYLVQAVGTYAAESDGVRGRFVRLDLPGDGKKYSRPFDSELDLINLAELQVFQGSENIALRKKARQSSTYASEAQYGASNAVNGDTVAQEGTNPFAHTKHEHNPWWEVDLGREQAIDRIVIWNQVGFERRLNHFRIRVLDEARNVVFEQVIDKPPRPSLEISCENRLVTLPPVANADKPQWSLRLNGGMGIDSGRQIRISSTQQLASPDKNELSDAAYRSLPLARLAACYFLNSETAQSADWFARALDNAKTENNRKQVLKQLQNHRVVLAELLRRQPDDLDLQLALARSHEAAGQKLLASEKTDEALVEFQTASGIFTSLREQNPEPEWTVLRPIEMDSEGGATLTELEDGSVLASGENPDRDVYRLVVRPNLKHITGIRLEALPDPSLPANGPGRYANSGNFHLNEMLLTSANGPVALTNAIASFQESSTEGDGPRNAIDGKVDGLLGWSVYGALGQPHTLIASLKLDRALDDDLKIEFHFSTGRLKQHNLGRFRLAATGEKGAIAAARIHLKIPNIELANLDAALGNTYAKQGKNDEAATCFARALDRVEEREDRQKIFELCKESLAALTLLAEQQLQDTPLQLALATSLSERGKNALAEQRNDEALSELASARAIFSRLAADHPESVWTVLHPTEVVSTAGSELTLLPDGSILASGENPDADTYTLTLGQLPDTVSAIRLEALTDDSLPSGGPGRPVNGNFALNRISFVAENESPLPWASAFADHSQQNHHVAKAIDGNLETGWQINVKSGSRNVDRFALFTLQKPWKSAGKTSSQIKLEFTGPPPGYNLGRFRISVTAVSNALEVAQLHHELKASGLADLEIALGKTQGRGGQVDEAATSFSQALDLAANHDSRAKILQQASAYAGVLDKLTKLRPTDAAFHAALARHFYERDELPNSHDATATARTLYEQQLAAEPTNPKPAKDLADLLNELKPPVAFVQFGAQEQFGGMSLVSSIEDGVTKSTTIHGQNCRVTEKARSGQGHGYAYFSFDDIHWASKVDAVVELAYLDTGSGSIRVQYDSQSNIFEGSAKVVTLTDSGEWTTARFVLKNVRFNKRQQGQADFRIEVENGPLYFKQVAIREHREGNNPLIQLAAAYHFLGDTDVSLKMLTQAIELAGTEEAIAEAAQEAAALEDEFPQLMKRFPNTPALRLGQAKYLASKHIQESQFQAAVDVVSSVLEEFPDDIELLNLRVSASIKLGQWESAHADYVRIIELETDDTRRQTAEWAQATCKLRLGQFKEGAEVYLQRMLLQSNDYAAIKDACSALMLAELPGIQKVAARRFYEKFKATTEPQRAGALVRVFTVQPGLITKTNSQRLLQLAETAGGAMTQPMTAAIHYRLGDLKQAEPLIAKREGQPEWEALAAMLLYDQGKTSDAQAFLSRCRTWFDSQRAKDLNNIVPSQQGLQRWGTRLAVWREAHSKIIGQRFLELEALLAKNPDLTPALLERAKLLTNVGMYRKALKDLNRLISLKVDASRLLELRGRILTGLNRNQEALPFLNQSIEEGSVSPRVYMARAGILAEQGEIEQALVDLKYSLDLEPSIFAAELLTELLTRQSTSPKVKTDGPWVKLALAFWQAADEAALTKLLQAHPESVPSLGDALRRIAWLQATSPNAQSRNGTEAIENATKACELTDWKHREYLNTLAASYAEAGDFESAIQWQKEAEILLDKEDVIIYKLESSAPAAWKPIYKHRLKLYQSGQPYREKPVAHGVQGTLTLNKSTYAPGENIVASFANGPGNLEDWICIYDRGFITEAENFTGNLTSHNWIYAGGSNKGEVTLDSSTLELGAKWPLPVGKYDVYFHCCGGYEVIAGPVTITVAKGDGKGNKNSKVNGEERTESLTEESRDEK